MNPDVQQNLTATTTKLNVQQKFTTTLDSIPLNYKVLKKPSNESSQNVEALPWKKSKHKGNNCKPSQMKKLKEWILFF